MSALDLSSDDKEHVTLKFKSDYSFSNKIILINSGIQDNIRVTIDYPSDYFDGVIIMI